jgi:hypothetical protein
LNDFSLAHDLTRAGRVPDQCLRRMLEQNVLPAYRRSDS